jgi:phage repressor protein C with HTH and peptisase S24 domain
MSVNDEVGTRLRQWRESLGLSREDVASRTGISMGTVRNQENGVTSPNAEHLLGYAELGLDPTWLVTGQEPPSHESQGQTVSPSQIVQTHFKPMVEGVPNEFTLIPRFDIQAAAGGGTVVDREDAAEMLAFRRDWLHRLGISAANARIITVRGDSMEPTLKSGDVILIDTDGERWFDDGIYVIRVDNRLLVKRIATKVGGAVLLISENPIYPPEEVPSADAIDIIGQVKWYGRVL